jgi:hypothetical protein
MVEPDQTFIAEQQREKQKIPMTTSRITGQLTVQHGDLYSGRMEVIKGSSSMNLRVVEINQRFIHKRLQKAVQ